jgi:hypothetical protein
MILKFYASFFRRARSGLGIKHSFARSNFVVRDAGDEAVAYAVVSVQAGGTDQAISWFVVVERTENVQDADVLPGHRLFDPTHSS